MSKRRTRGDGGLTQRHDHPTCPPAVDGERPKHSCRGRWQATINVELPNGRTTRKTLYGRTQKEAKAKLDAARLDRERGALVAKSPTVKTWMADWLEKKKRPPKPLKPSTWNGYETKVRTYIVPALGTKRLSALRPQHVDALYDDLRDRGLQEATIRQTHAILKKALNDAVRVGVLGRTPMDRVTSPGTGVNDRDQFTLPQAAIALRSAGDSARWWLALFYGMRQGEVLGLRWDDIDWDAHALSIEQTRQPDYKTVGERKPAIVGTPKSKASRRTLPMMPQVEVRLRLLWDATGQPTTGLVFPSRSGGLADRTADNRAWHAFIEAAGLPPIALHAARNSASSLMEAAGIPDRVVMQILGQSTLKVTHRYQRAELERVRDYLSGASKLLELD